MSPKRLFNAKLKPLHFKHGFTLLALFFCSILNLNGQHFQGVHWDTLHSFPSFFHQYLNSENGLLQNEVTALYLNRQRFLWIATQQGLVRYSGRKTKVFTTNNSPLIFHDRIRDFYKSPEQELLVFFENNTYVKLNDKGNGLAEATVLHSDYYFSYKGNMASRKALDNYRFMQVSMDSLSAYSYHESSGKPLVYYHQRKAYPMDYQIDHYNENNFFKIDSFAYCFDRKGFLLRFNRTNVDTISHNPGFAEKGKGKLIWAAYQDHPYYFQAGALYRIELEANGMLRFIKIADELPNLEYQVCVENHLDNQIFLGTKRNGLLQLYPKTIKQLFNEDYCDGSYKNYNIVEVGYDSVLTADAVLFTPDTVHCNPQIMPRTETWTPLAFHPVEKQVYSLYDLNEPGTAQVGEWKWKPLDFSLRNHPAIPGPMAFYNGEVYFYAEDYGLTRIINRNWQLVLPVSELEGLGGPQQILFWNDSLVYVAWGIGNALGLLNLKQGSVAWPEEFRNLKHPYRCMSKIDGQLWLGTYGGGVYVYDKEKLYHVNFDDYPALGVVHAIVQAGEYLLFSTNNGLFAFRTLDLQNSLFDEEQKLQAYSFSERDGLFHTEFNGGVQSPYLKLSSGKWAFPNLRGLSFLDDSFWDQLPFNSGQVFCDKIEYNNNDSLLDLSIPIDPNFNRLKFNIDQPYFGGEVNALVYYRVPEIASDWYPLDFEKGISFDRLPSAQSYSIEVYIPGADEGMIQKTLFTFTIGPRYFETTQFYLLMFFLLVFCISLLVAMLESRNKRQKARLNLIIGERTADLARNNVSLRHTVEELKESKGELRHEVQMRNKMITVFSHDIRGPLRFMADIAEGLNQKASNLEYREIEEELRVLSGGARGAYQTASNVLNWIKTSDSERPNRFTKINEAISYVIQKNKARIDRYGLQIYWEAWADFEIVSKPGTLEIILENLIDNAAKFGRESVTIKAEQALQKGFVIIKVTDDGDGVQDLSKLTKLNQGKSIGSSKGKRNDIGAGIGLLMVWEIVKQLNGQIRFENKPRGFEVSVLLPKNPKS